MALGLTRPSVFLRHKPGVAGVWEVGTNRDDIRGEFTNEMEAVLACDELGSEIDALFPSADDIAAQEEEAANGGEGGE